MTGKAQEAVLDEGIQVSSEGHSGGIRRAFQGHPLPKKGIRFEVHQEMKENVWVFEMRGC